MTGLSRFKAHRDSRLTILGTAAKRGRYQYLRCQCECGMIKEYFKQGVMDGSVRSCGCLARSAKETKKGVRVVGSPELIEVYEKMLDQGPTAPTCITWREFNIFRLWALRNGYEDGMQLGRKNERLGFRPSNCFIIGDEGELLAEKDYSGTVTGLPGVYYARNKAKKFFSRVRNEGKLIDLGSFETAEKAHEARYKYCLENGLMKCLVKYNRKDLVPNKYK